MKPPNALKHKPDHIWLYEDKYQNKRMSDTRSLDSRVNGDTNLFAVIVIVQTAFSQFYYFFNRGGLITIRGL